MNVRIPPGCKYYYARFQVNKKEYNRTTKCTDKAKALKVARVMRAAAIEGTRESLAALEKSKARSDVATIGAIVDVYLRLPKRCNNTTATRNVGNLLAMIEQAVGSKPRERSANVLTRELVEKWMEKRQGLGKLDRSTGRQCNVSINSGYNQAKDVFADYLMYDLEREGLKLPDLRGFRKAPKLPTPRAGWEPWPKEAYAAMHKASLLLKDAHPNLWLCNQLLRRLGLRNSELLAARVDWIVDISGGRKGLKVCDRPKQGFQIKGALPRVLPLGDDLLELFAGRDGYLIDIEKDAARLYLIEREHNRWIKQFIPDRTKGNHELRKHVGSQVLTHNGEPAAQRFLGHTSPETTRKWYATFLGDQAEITAEAIAVYDGTVPDGA